MSMESNVIRLAIEDPAYTAATGMNSSVQLGNLLMLKDCRARSIDRILWDSFLNSPEVRHKVLGLTVQSPGQTVNVNR